MLAEGGIPQFANRYNFTRFDVCSLSLPAVPRSSLVILLRLPLVILLRPSVFSRPLSMPSFGLV